MAEQRVRRHFDAARKVHTVWQMEERVASEAAAIRRLQREVEFLHVERDLLKRASAYFAKES